MTDTPSTITRLAILASGAGQHLQSLTQAIQAGILHASIELVVSDTINAPALQYARLQGLKAVGLAAQSFSDATSYQKSLARRVAASQPDWILLTDFEPVMAADFARHFPNRILAIQSGQAGQAQLQRLMPDGQTESINPTPAHTDIATLGQTIGALISAQRLGSADDNRHPVMAASPIATNPDHNSRIYNA